VVETHCNVSDAQGHNHLMLATEPAWPRFVDEMNRFLAEVG
jgi:hypothetical protein